MERDDQANVHPESGHSPEPGPDAGSAVDTLATDVPETGRAGPTNGDDETAAIQADLEGQHLLELWSDRDEIHALPEILRPAEGLVAVGSGTVVKSARLAQSNWLVVLTDRRLLCLKGRSAVTRKVIDMPVSQVRGVETTGIFRKTLSLDTGYGTLRLSGLKKSFALEMVEGITALMGAYREGAAQKATAIPKADLSKAGERGHTHEELQVLEDAVGQLRDTLGDLAERLTFLEELVRSNVAGPADQASGDAAAVATGASAPGGTPAPAPREPSSDTPDADFSWVPDGAEKAPAPAAPPGGDSGEDAPRIPTVGDTPDGAPGAKPAGGPPGVKPAGGPPGAKPAGGPPGAKPASGPPGAKPAGGPPGAKPASGPPGARPAGGPPTGDPAGAGEPPGEEHAGHGDRDQDLPRPPEGLPGLD